MVALIKHWMQLLCYNYGNDQKWCSNRGKKSREITAGEIEKTSKKVK
jgi:hypothetical protein